MGIPSPLSARWLSHRTPAALPSGEMIGQVIQGLGGTEEISRRLGASTLTELRSIEGEQDPLLFYNSLIQLAGRLEQRHHDGEAVLLYAAVRDAAPETLSGIRDTAGRRRDALLGVGATGPRVEVLTRRFAREATSPAMLLSMGGAQIVFGATRLALLSRLTASPARGFFTGGIGARGLASTLAFAAEGPAFVGIHRGLNHAMGTETAGGPSFGQELFGTYLTLGGLKLLGAGGGAAFQRLHRVNPLTGQAARWAGITRLTQPLLTQGATLGGIYLGHSLETVAGIRPRTDAATTFIDSLSTLAQFAVAGRLMNGTFGREWRQLNREIQLRSEIAAQPNLASSWLNPARTLSVPGMALATANGAPIPSKAPVERFLNRPMLMAMANGGEGEGGVPSSFPPPSGLGSPSVPPPPASHARPRGSRTNGLVRFVQGVHWTARKLDLNAGMDPEAPLTRLPTVDPSPPIRSVREGMARARELGHHRRTLAFLRWGAHQLKELPETQRLFLGHMQRVLEFQTRQQALLNPVLEKLPHFDFGPLNQLGERYAQALEKLTPGSGRFYAEARLLLERTREWTNEEQFRNLSPEQLRELGLEPDAAEATSRHAYAFTPEEIREITDHPLLRELPATQTIREAFGEFQTERARVLSNLETASQEIAEKRSQIAATEDVERRKELEGEIRNISIRPNQGYIRATSTLNRAMRNYLEDPLRARVFLVQSARLSSLRRGLQDLDTTQLANHIRQHLEELSGPARARAQEFLGAAEESALVSERGALSRFFLGAARVVNLDPHPPLQVQGRLERALLGLIQETPMEFWRFGDLETQALAEATRIQSEYYNSLHETTTRLRRELAPLEQANDAYWEAYDREAAELYVGDLRLQLSQVREAAARLHADPRKAPGFDTEAGLRYGQLVSAAEEAIGTYADPKTRGNNSRDANRNLEVGLQRFAALREFLRENLPREFQPRGGFRGISALMLPFVDKMDSSKRPSWTEILFGPLLRPFVDKMGSSKRTRWIETNFGALRPLAWRTVLRSAGLMSSVSRKETVSVTDRHFLNWAFGLTRNTGSEFIVDPNVDYLVESAPVVVPGNHNAWLDFLYGGTPAARAAQLQGRGSSRDALRIAAKQGLGRMIGPTIEEAIELLTESIADSLPAYDGSVTNLARAMAYGDIPGARPGPRSSAVYDELTMSVASLIHPYAFDPFPAISSILAAPQGGRSFNIADRATALTGRPQSLLMTSTLNGYRLWPKPDRPYPLREGETVTATQWVPALGLYDIGAKGKNVGGTRANWLRSYWLHMATVPEHQREVRSIERMFEPFEGPGDLQIETTLARMFSGAAGVYPNEAAVRSLEASRESLSASDTPEARRQLEWVERTLDSQTRELVRLKLQQIDQRIEAERNGSFPTPESPGVIRLQRIVRARLKLLDKVERNLEAGKELSLTERRFVEKMGATLAGRRNTAGLDREIEQLEYYFHLRSGGTHDLTRNLEFAQRSYYLFVKNWNERRKNPVNPEYDQLHISEAEGYQREFHNYRRAAETLLNLRGVTPRRWEGRIVPDMVFRREGDATVIEPLGWQPSQEFSRAKMWRFLLDDTRGIVRVAVRLKDFDPTPNLYSFIHATGWGWRLWDRIQTRIRIENSERIREVGNTPSLVTPTHDSGFEFPTVPAVMWDYGIQAFFMADRKFSDPFPKPPAFGLIRALLGPMEQYGHLAIDRSDRRAAMQVMGVAGRYVRDQGRSVIVFPGGTRNPVRFDENGERFEGPLYGSRPGVAMSMEEANVPLIPMGLVNGGIIFPKQNSETLAGKGAAIGREYIVRFGTPVHRNGLDPINPAPKGADLRRLVVANLDRQYGELTGREVGPPAPSKAKKGK